MSLILRISVRQMEAAARSRPTLVAAVAALLLWAGPAAAEAVLDGSTGSTGSFSGAFTIPAAVGRQEGANLFHSFESFRIRNGESATFTGPGGIDNVISRVTGGELSRINGPLASTIAGADFFFLNPSGVVFGPNASLSLPGSFHVSTADELRFADGSRFSASDPVASSFTMASPEAFGFLGSGGAITVDRSFLATATGADLSLSGSDVSVTAGSDGAASGGSAGFVAATDGALQIAAIRSGSLVFASGEVTAAESGSVAIDDEASVLALTLGNGAIRISADRLDVDDAAAVQILNFGAAADTAGIDVRADRVRVRRGGTIGSSARSTGTGGPVRITASDLVLRGGSIESETQAAGGGGPIAITTGRLEATDGRGILSSTLPGTTGDGGDIDIEASSILIEEAAIDLTKFGTGGAGQLFIEAQDVVLRGPTFGIFAINPTTGDSGRIEIVADRLTVDGAGILSNTLDTSEGGDLVLEIGRLDIENGGLVSTASLGPGDAGAISITTDELNVTGLGSGILVNSIDETAAGGDGGSLTVDAGTVRVLDDASISSETSGGGDAGGIVIGVDGELLLDDGGQIRASSEGAGRPGDISLDVGSLTLGAGGTISSLALATGAPGDDGSATIRIVAADGVTIDGTADRIAGVSTATLGPRDAGTVRIETQRLELVGDALLSSSTLGPADAGAVVLLVEDLIVGLNGTIDSAAPNSDQPDLPGGGGEIRIVASGSVTVSGDRAGDRPGRITTRTSTAGDAGEIRLQAPLVRLEEGGLITSETRATGDGGRVRIEGGRIVLDGASSITTRSTATGPDAGVAGGIRLIASESLRLADGAAVSAETEIAEAGDIVVTVDELVELRSASITTSVAGGQGSGGNIFIDPEFVVLDDSRIVANAREGAGGDIRIVAENFFTTPGSTVDASSELGIDGTVDIDAPDLDLTSELAVLPTAFVDVSGLLRESCAARAGDETSSFATDGGRALSPDPGAPLRGRYGLTPSPATFHHWTLGRAECRGG